MRKVLQLGSCRLPSGHADPRELRITDLFP